MTPHPIIVCVKDTGLGALQSVCGGGRNAGWKQRFVCPTCQRKGTFALNFLGRRAVMCNGQKFSKVTR